MDPAADPGFYSRVFMIPEPGSNKIRPIIDLSALNAFAIVKHFKMETGELIRASLSSSDWVTRIDLTDAYYHVPMAKVSCQISQICT